MIECVCVCVCVCVERDRERGGGGKRVCVSVGAGVGRGEGRRRDSKARARPGARARTVDFFAVLGDGGARSRVFEGCGEYRVVPATVPLYGRGRFKACAFLLFFFAAAEGPRFCYDFG